MAVRGNIPFLKFISSDKVSPYQIEDVCHEITEEQLQALREIVTNLNRHKKKNGKDWIDKYCVTNQLGKGEGKKIEKFINERFLTRKATRVQLRKYCFLFKFAAAEGLRLYNTSRQAVAEKTTAAAAAEEKARKRKQKKQKRKHIRLTSTKTNQGGSESDPDNNSPSTDADDDEDTSPEELRLIGKSPKLKKAKLSKKVVHIEEEDEEEDEEEEEEEEDNDSNSSSDEN
jgi:ribosomal protein S15P/S13E